MKLLEPLLVGSYSITQLFSGNANPYYAGHGLKGHPAVDFYQGYNRSITSSHDGLVYKTFNKDNPDLSSYRAVCVIFQENGNWYELTYGHCNKIYVKAGDVVSAGDLLASMGNTGDVYSQGLLVEEDKRTKPPYPGTHLHWQLRKCVRVMGTQAGRDYLYAQDGRHLHDENGYYEIIDYDNGYNGCIDPLPFLYKPGLIERAGLFIKLGKQLAQLSKS